MASGSIAGLVTNASGVPQMGATAVLFNRFDRLCQRVLTDDKGLFAFENLLPGAYTVRISLAAFLPARQLYVGHKMLAKPASRNRLHRREGRDRIRDQLHEAVNRGRAIARRFAFH